MSVKTDFEGRPYSGLDASHLIFVSIELMVSTEKHYFLEIVCIRKK